MLPAHLLLVTSHENHPGRAAPRYLTPRDEVWVQKVAIARDAFVGRTVGERNAELPALARAIAREHGAAKRVADGVVHVLVRQFTTEIDAAADPSHVRRITFEEAAREETFNRGAALASAAHRLSLTVDAAEHALFADRPSRRKITAAKATLNAGELVEAYNLALVQGLLVRSEQVWVEVREHVRAVVRFAKLASLLCTYSVCESGTRLDVSGPLPILRHTTKYGFALASFFPAVVATSGFRLEARCVLGASPCSFGSTRATGSLERTSFRGMLIAPSSAHWLATSEGLERPGRSCASPTQSPSVAGVPAFRAWRAARSRQSPAHRLHRRVARVRRWRDSRCGFALQTSYRRRHADRRCRTRARNSAESAQSVLTSIADRMLRVPPWRRRK